MRLFLALIALVTANEVADRAVFEEWKVDYDRVYESSDEEAYRFKLFQANLRDYEYRTEMELKVGGPGSAVFGPGQFADMTNEEFRKKIGRTMPEDCLQSNSNNSMSLEEARRIIAENGDDTIDWRTKGAVTPVKNQGQYGTCWAFGATGTMEGMSVAQSKIPLESISEQELIDCSPCGGYVGCCLSWYVSKMNGQADTEESYPYKGRSGSCRSSSATLAKMKIKDRVCEANGAGGNQDVVLADLIKYGPGSCLIDAGCVQGYKSGIISNCPKKAGDIDHATLFVGAGTDNGKPYWIVKNSWGTSFGMKGYYMLERNTNPPQAGVPGGIFGVAP